MRVDIPLEIDLGPLAWVKDEVTMSLGRARRDVEALVGNQPVSPEVLQRALDEVHQTSGAFELIGIDGLATFTREIERHLKTLVDEPGAESAPKVLAGVQTALRRLSSHLEEVFSGAPCKPTMLTREYAALHRLRGAEAGAADLFFPDLNRKPPRLEGASPVPPDRLPGYLQVARRGYERGLLAWLRGNASGLVVMRENVESVERAFPLPAQRSFWWAVGALFYSLEDASTSPSVAVKQLSARIDLQVRRFVEGSTKISDRLRREVLFHVARATSTRSEVKQVQALYELDRLIPSPGVNLRSAIDFVSLRPAIDALMATVVEARNTWQRVIAGQGETRASLREKCADASRGAGDLNRPHLAALLGLMGEVIPLSPTQAISDQVGIEYSAALLFVETALANFAGDAQAYEDEAKSLVEQLRAASVGLDVGDQPKPIHAITRRVQERESFKALVGEVRENLAAVESGIDAWVRGNGALDGPAMRAKMNQIVGVLAVSEQPAAVTSAQEIERLISNLDGANSADDQSAGIGKVAELLSRLGFYIDAKRLQPDADLTHLLDGPEHKAAVDAADAVAHVEEESMSVEVDVRRQRKQLSGLVARWQEDPNNALTRTEVERSLKQLLDDARLLGNADLVGATREALNALQIAKPDGSAISLAQTVVTSDMVPVPGMSSQTQALMGKDAPALDSALVDIFLEESDEILGNLAPLIATLDADASDAEALVSARRSFHTLKGSGRMVGLRELGEAAWGIEQHLNHRIQTETPIHRGDVALLATAREQFGLWVASIRLNLTDVGFDRAALDIALAQVQSEDLVESTLATGILERDSGNSQSLGADAALPISGGAALSAIALVAAADSPATKVATEIAIEAQPIDSFFAFEADAYESAARPNVADEQDQKATAVPGAQPWMPVAGSLTSADSYFRTTDTTSQDDEVARMFGAGSPLDGPTRFEMDARHVDLDVQTISLLGGSVGASAAIASGFGKASATANVAIPDARAPETLTTRYQLPDTLRTLVTEEAATYLATLTAEVERMQVESGVKPGDEMIRAAHTLRGMHLSVGLTEIGELAGSLESALVALKHRPYSEDDLASIATAVAALQSLSFCVRDQVEPDAVDLDFVAIAKSSLEHLHDGNTRLSADALIDQSHGDTPTIAPVLSKRVIDALNASDPANTPNVFFSPLNPAPSHPSALGEALHSPASYAGELGGTVAASSESGGTASGNAPEDATVNALAFDGNDAATSQPLTAKVDQSAPSAFSPPSFAANDSAPLVAEAAEANEAPEPEVKPTSATQALAFAGLAALAVGTAAQTPVAAAIQAESTPRAQTVPSAQMFAPVPVRTDPIADIRDDLEPSVLEIFIEEAHELFPTASAQLRQWRGAPADREVGNALKRTMHTLKGSARMAGAMRLGELAHRLESRLETDDFNRSVAVKTFDEIEADLDGIAFLLDRLEKGESNVPLPGYEPSLSATSFVPFVEAETEDHVAAAATALAAAQHIDAQPERVAAVVADLPKTVETVAFIPSAQIDVPATHVAAFAPLPHMAATVAPMTGDAMRWLSEENASQNQVLRVRADAIERLADETGEVSISRSRMDSELKSLRGNLNELTSSVMRLRAQVREIEIQAETQIQSRLSQVQDTDSGFDPLEFDRFTRFQELTRSLAEGVNDVATVQQSIVSNLDTTDAALNAQGRIARSLQNQLQSIRTVAFTSLRERLYRVMRQSARDLGKRANMEIRGGELSLDRSVIERLAPLVEHVLRNALAHGVELPGARTTAGKSETGEISIELRQQGNLVEISIADDGVGFNVPAIRSKAIAQGFAQPDQLLTDAQWIDHVFLSGFTTASEITSVSGRGVGMDVVRTEINALGGRVEAHHVEGKGAQFNLYVPLTLTLLNAVMVRVGRHRYGIPASMVETVKSVRASEYVTALSTGSIQHGREQIRFVPMHPCVGEVLTPREENLSQAIVVRSGSTVIALDVDAVLGNQEVVLKRMGPQLGRVPALLGVSLLGDGDIVLLYNPISLVGAFAQREDIGVEAAALVDAQSDSAAAQGAGIAEISALATDVAAPVVVAPRRLAPVVPIRPTHVPVEKPLVMVVDDSLTVRKITTRFLEREGFRAISAKDGMEALTLLSDHTPQVILLDIEMPRMDGFEFTRAAKGDANLRQIPIIMITSRTAEKHRNHAKELGVDVYLGKPYQDDELLSHIETFVRRTETV